MCVRVRVSYGRSVQLGHLRVSYVCVCVCVCVREREREYVYRMDDLFNLVIHVFYS